MGLKTLGQDGHGDEDSSLCIRVFFAHGRDKRFYQTEGICTGQENRGVIGPRFEITMFFNGKNYTGDYSATPRTRADPQLWRNLRGMRGEK